MSKETLKGLRKELEYISIVARFSSTETRIVVFVSIFFVLLCIILLLGNSVSDSMGVFLLHGLLGGLCIIMICDIILSRAMRVLKVKYLETHHIDSLKYSKMPRMYPVVEVIFGFGLSLFIIVGVQYFGLVYFLLFFLSSILIVGIIEFYIIIPKSIRPAVFKYFILRKKDDLLGEEERYE